MKTQLRTNRKCALPVSNAGLHTLSGNIRRTRILGIRAVCVAALLALLIAMSACTRPAAAQSGTQQTAKDGTSQQATQGQQRPGAASGEQTVFPVSVTDAVRGDINDYIAVTGGIEPANEVDVYADTSGQLVKLSVRLGEYVRQNQIVAEVDPSRPGQNFVPNPVRAPIAGTITSLPVDVGARITQGVPVVRISTISDLKIKTQVAERYIGDIRIGENAIVALEPYPNQSFAATVVELSPVVDPQTRTMDVTLKFVHPDNRVKSGMFSEIRIITQHKQGVVKIPSEAIVERDGKQFVFVAGADEKAVRKNVKIGINIDGKAEITEGLAAGDKVVIRGQTLLEDGARIKVIEQLPALPAQDTVL